MMAVILAGGLRTRISEETHIKSKPMIENRWAGNSLGYNEIICSAWS